jgi:hypothetical protein
MHHSLAEAVVMQLQDLGHLPHLLLLSWRLRLQRYHHA